MMTELPEHIKHIEVRSFGEAGGELTQPAQYCFQYTGNQPVSLTMQIKKEPYNRGSIHPVFAQNLPEGYVRHFIYKKLERHAKVNDLYLLALQKDRGIGHLVFDSSIDTTLDDQLSLSDILTWKGEASIFPELLNRYYLGGFASGMQPKVLLSNVKATITQERYIVKSFDEEYPLLTVNEYVCMEAARAAGLSPPKCWLSEDLNTFVIERFDFDQGEKLGFEDFSVLTGQDKYRGSYETLLKAIALFTKKPAEVKRGFEYIVFNCLIGNGDAHLKNFAVQYSKARNDITLTPPYDITHTPIYPTVGKNMALKLCGAKSFPGKDDLIKLGHHAKIKGVEQIIERIADSISDYIKKSNEIKLIRELRGSIESSLSKASSVTIINPPYRHDKKRKYDANNTSGLAK
jgi:serine/threonine-protein kinase HipA